MPQHGTTPPPTCSGKGCGPRHVSSKKAKTRGPRLRGRHRALPPAPLEAGAAGQLLRLRGRGLGRRLRGRSRRLRLGRRRGAGGQRGPSAGRARRRSCTRQNRSRCRPKEDTHSAERRRLLGRAVCSLSPFDRVRRGRAAPPSALAGAAGRAGREGSEGMALRPPGRAGSVGMALLRGAFAPAPAAAGTPLGACSVSGASPPVTSILCSLLTSFTSLFAWCSAGPSIQHVGAGQVSVGKADRAGWNVAIVELNSILTYLGAAAAVLVRLWQPCWPGRPRWLPSAPLMARLNIAPTLMGDPGSCEWAVTTVSHPHRCMQPPRTVSPKQQWAGLAHP